MRQPDSGLVIDADKNGLLTSLNINPTTIDPFRATTTISNYSFTLLDKDNIITAMLNNDSKYFQDEQVEIWLGRVDVDMDFSDYLKLPDTYVSKCSRQDSRYTFSTQEVKDRLATGAFNTVAKLSGSILSGTTTIGLQSIPANWPSTGYALIDQEFIQWTSVNGNDLEGCTRGEFTTTPAAHDIASDVVLIESIQDNPINILLKLLISGGGGGTYDTLSDGCGIDESLIDIDQFEQIRDELFSTYTFRFRLGGIDKIQDFIAQELCFPLGVRLRANNNSKIGLALIDRNIFDIDSPVINHDVLTKQPGWVVDDTKITNRIRIFWDYDDATKSYLKVSEFIDTDSITEFGNKDWKEYRFKGVLDSLNGSDFVNAFQLLLFGRFAFPKPLIDVNTFMKSSFLAMGDKVNVESSLIPNNEGSLEFASTLEVIQKNINILTGDCRFQLSFTSFTGVKICYLAPSDTITSFVSQKVVNIGAGRGDNYRAGWKMRLYNNSDRDLVDSQVNTIESINVDQITFVDDWDETLVNNRFRMMFADYDDVVEQQKKFCFISSGSNEFSDGKSPYKISFG
jgi:hypothetical protein